MNNYRGISVLTPTSKCFEKIMADQMRIYFEVNSFFYRSQHGFRNLHSCESALHEIVSRCLNNIVKNKVIELITNNSYAKSSDLINPYINLSLSPSTMNSILSKLNIKTQIIKSKKTSQKANK